MYYVISFFEWFGDLGTFCARMARSLFVRPFEFREFVRQLDAIGSKSLPLVALAGAATIFLSNSHEDLLVWALVLFIASFAFSQGAVIWVYLSEVFPTRVRAQGQSLGSFTHWAMNALISFIFPIP